MISSSLNMIFPWHIQAGVWTCVPNWKDLFCYSDIYISFSLGEQDILLPTPVLQSIVHSTTKLNLLRNLSW
ncbi:hypothetical protein KC19_2G281100 [Ceratodon purpureus]|uniref:Uncharacterized protein n=1 Tax=Ceratodon purpureus TaxID=3225 RepID=A0A8T0J1Q3_CERPU|nr:hypothetical protein KC19_2G281100 [Ceratodon purpureus]